MVGASVVASQANPPSEGPASHLGFGSCSDHSTYDPAPLWPKKQQMMAQVLGPLHLYGRPRSSPCSWLWPLLLQPFEE